MGTKLYVGNLSYDVSNASLETMFSPFGSVKSAEVIHDRDTGRSKGFGFVGMANDNATLKAIRGLNESDQGGRPLTVNEARPREQRSGAMAVTAPEATIEVKHRPKHGQYLSNR